MRKKQGFTLIELLAVIVILAVIALIATPIIIGIIEDSKVKANENSAYGIIDSVKYYYTEGLLKPENTVKYNENILDALTYNGEQPKSGSWASVDKDGNVGVALLYGNKCYLKEYSESKIKEGEKDNCKITIPTEIISLKDSLTRPENLVTSGNGLYKINDSEYKYRGGCKVSGVTCIDVDSVHNHIKLGQYLYRIIGIDSNGIKVISVAKLSSDVFDPDGTNIFDTSDSNTNNIGYYLNKDANALEEIKYLRTIATTMIWNIGGVAKAANSSLDMIKAEEKGNISTFQIGLMSVSDYIEASTDIKCLTNPLVGSTDSQSCRNNNWLFHKNNGSPYLINSRTTSSTELWYVNSTNSSLGTCSPTGARGIFPVFYLSSDTIYNGGDGTLDNPFIINK